MALYYTVGNIKEHYDQPYLFENKSWLYYYRYHMRKKWWSDFYSMVSRIYHTYLNAMLVESISVDVVVWMMLVLLNDEYSIAGESHNNDVGLLANWAQCSAERVNSESNGENWVKYAIIRFTININGNLIENIYTTAGKYDCHVMNGK